MNKLLRMLLLVVVLCMMLLPLSSAYVRAYGDEVETYGVEQEASETARDDAQFLRIEVTRKEDDVIIKADDTKRSAAKDGATKGQGYINTSMAEYNATDLSGYTTEELVVFILNNHRSMSSALYDHALDPYSSAKRYYHGLEELESHEDALDVLYRALTVLEEAEPTTDRERIVYDMRVDFIHMLLNSEFYQGKISGENSLAYGETVQSELSTNVSRSLIGAYGFLYDYAGTVYSRGNEVVSVYSATSDHADEQKEQIRDRLCEAHPNAIYRSEATSKYNGISYAWYSASTSNVYCIFDLSPYLRDAHTSWVEVESWSECQVNDIIVYYNADGEPIHAAIVTANDNGDVVEHQSGMMSVCLPIV